MILGLWKSAMCIQGIHCKILLYLENYKDSILRKSQSWDASLFGNGGNFLGGTHTSYMSLFAFVCLSVTHHISATVHHVIMIFGTHV